MRATSALFRPRHGLSLALALALLAVGAWTAPAGAADAEGTALLAQVDRNLQPESFEMYRKLINIEPDGTRKEFVLYSVKKGPDKVLAEFLAPASEQGRSTLRLGENMWLYIPNVGRPIRITSLQSVVGGVFNNADILRVDYATEYKVAAMHTEADAHVLTLRARHPGVAYDRLEMWVDRTHVVPTRIEAYGATGLLIKTLHYRELKDFGDGILRPAVLETDSPLYKGYKSVILWAKITPRPLDDEVFALNFMPRVHELR